ncbi:Tachykinin-like peptides receptor 86C [Amphibalanus amphitrite]|uniref:Tachykinin-like peptides receptor 86C n=1 Tax=Amphibalanus amphitrite TaxID=1232801 RepID=A0A6A4WND3_AMPAM|nr:Tachykinin-like peptides receptor 86C [Amphibalanus amphitrite]
MTSAALPQLVRMFIIVVSTFALCWLPYQVYFVYTYHDTTLAKEEFVQSTPLRWVAKTIRTVDAFLFRERLRLTAAEAQVIRRCALSVACKFAAAAAAAWFGTLLPLRRLWT